MSFRTQRDLDRPTLPPGKAEVFHFDARCPGAVRPFTIANPALLAYADAVLEEWWPAPKNWAAITLAGF